VKKGHDIAVIGYGETKITLRGGRSAYDLAGEVLEKILEQTGIEKSEIDGLAIGETMSSCTPSACAAR
jgi:acetyl-CoA acetyltransferase